MNRKMRSFKSWKEELASKKEGVNPTDIDSAGMDQDLDNTGIPYDRDAIEKVALIDRERDEIDREYQKKLFDKAFPKKPENDDPNDLDVTKGPQGETKGGTIDANIKTYLMNKFDKENARRSKSRAEREKVNAKVSSTFFRQDQDASRNDTGVTGGNADKHSEDAED